MEVRLIMSSKFCDITLGSSPMTKRMFFERITKSKSTLKQQSEMAFERCVDKFNGVQSWFCSKALNYLIKNEKDVVFKSQKEVDPVISFFVGLTKDYPSKQDIVKFFSPEEESQNDIARALDFFALMGDEYNSVLMSYAEGFKKNFAVSNELYTALLSKDRISQLRKMLVHMNMKNSYSFFDNFIASWIVQNNDENRLVTATELYTNGMFWDCYCLMKLFRYDNTPFGDEVKQKVLQDFVGSLEQKHPELAQFLLTGEQRENLSAIHQLMMKDISESGPGAVREIFEAFENNEKIENFLEKLEKNTILSANLYYVLLRSIVADDKFVFTDLIENKAIESFASFNVFSDLQQLIYQNAVRISKDIVRIFLKISNEKVEPSKGKTNYLDDVLAAWEVKGVFSDLHNDLRRGSVLSFIQKLESSINLSGFKEISLDPKKQFETKDQWIEYNRKLPIIVKSALRFAYLLVEMIGLKSSWDHESIDEILNREIYSCSNDLTQIYTKLLTNSIVASNQEKTQNEKKLAINPTTGKPRGSMRSPSYEQTVSTKDEIVMLVKLADDPESIEINQVLPEETPSEPSKPSQEDERSYTKEFIQNVGQNTSLKNDLKDTVNSGLPEFVNKIRNESTQDADWIEKKIDERVSMSASDPALAQKQDDQVAQNKPKEPASLYGNSESNSQITSEDSGFGRGAVKSQLNTEASETPVMPTPVGDDDDDGWGPKKTESTLPKFGVLNDEDRKIIERHQNRTDLDRTVVYLNNGGSHRKNAAPENQYEEDRPKPTTQFQISGFGGSFGNASLNSSTPFGKPDNTPTSGGGFGTATSGFGNSGGFGNANSGYGNDNGYRGGTRGRGNAYRGSGGRIRGGGGGSGNNQGYGSNQGANSSNYGRENFNSSGYHA
ncbi:unnamed protein product [Caenorhabditis auriculariae]|uniref:Uncharacterized protein n=1 Tax=Caenorhabditis auriculariae TaxID=2777116 RepID=A0A8S1HX89_9PELO|nr:unnamed protein product [Caenorhabditis auriculariae]